MALVRVKDHATDDLNGEIYAPGDTFIADTALGFYADKLAQGVIEMVDESVPPPAPLPQLPIQSAGRFVAKPIDSQAIVKDLRSPAQPLQLYSDAACSVPLAGTLGSVPREGAFTRAPDHIIEITPTGGVLYVQPVYGSAAGVADAASYGADPDASDNQDAIQAAIDAGTKIVYLSGAGAIFDTSSLTVREGLTIVIDGATLRRKAGATGGLLTKATAITTFHLLFHDSGAIDNNDGTDHVVKLDQANGHSDLLFEGGVWKNLLGKRAVSVGVSGDGLNSKIHARFNDFQGDTTTENFLAVQVLNGAEFYAVLNRFEGQTLKNETSTALTSVGRGTYFIGNRFEDCQASAMLIRPHGNTQLEDILVAFNSGREIGYDPGGALNKGLAVIGESTSAGTNMARRVRVIGNRIKFFGGNGIVCGGGAEHGQCEDVVIALNQIDASNMSDVIDDTWKDPNLGINVINTNGYVVLGNTIRRVGRGAIRQFGESGKECRNGVVALNVVDEAVAKTDNTSPASSQECGIYAYTYVRDAVWALNVVKNTGYAASNASGLGVQKGTCSGIIIALNRSFDDRGTPFQKYGVRLGYPGNADGDLPSNITTVFNDLRGNVTNGYASLGTIATDHGNSKFGNQGTSADPSYPAPRILSGYKSGGWDPPSIADGAMASTTLTVLGAAISDAVVPSFSVNAGGGVPAGALLVGAVTAADTVTVTLFNKTGGALDLGLGALRVIVMKTA